jgi:hypothetical protein
MGGYMRTTTPDQRRRIERSIVRNAFDRKSLLRHAIAITAALVVMIGGCAGESGSPGGESGWPVTITIGSDGNVNRFHVAAGSAVDDELMCSTGAVESQASDVDSDPWSFERVLVCDDDVGSITVRAEGPANSDFLAPLEGSWSVVEGSGQFSEIDGGGVMVVDFSQPPAVETYTGSLSR